MYLIPVFLLFVFLVVFEYLTGFKTILLSIGFLFISIVIMGIVLAIDFSSQTHDTEVWSGRVVDWKHNEEWDEWIPPVTTCSTDSNGNQTCTTTPGYWVHHDAENFIKTTDDGWVTVKQSPDGKRFDDNFPNDTVPLQEYWKKNTPTASVHSYTNRVRASYSLYKHKEVDLEQYTDLPKYPNQVRDVFHIDRIVGSVPNKEKANELVAEKNAELNKMVPDPKDKSKKRSWKQVNMIFVNVGNNKKKEYGYALEDYWEGGKKNDFIVSFSTDKEGNILWVYPFSWSESQLLKYEVRDYMMDLKKIEDFVPIVEKVSDLVVDKYERKEFSDFNYLKIEPSLTSYIVIWIFMLIVAGVRIYVNVRQTSRYSYRRF